MLQLVRAREISRTFCVERRICNDRTGVYRQHSPSSSDGHAAVWNPGKCDDCPGLPGVGIWHQRSCSQSQESVRYEMRFVRKYLDKRLGRCDRVPETNQGAGHVREGTLCYGAVPVVSGHCGEYT